ncbi:MAG: glyoxylate/hydroxypyruvate reductase A [Pseudomonadota bacterium]
MKILIKSDFDRGDDWRKAFADRAPEMTLIDWPYQGDPAAIDYAAVWKMPHGELARFDNLKAIFSLGAGIDHLANDLSRPPQVPVVRLVEPGLTAGMTEFAVMSVLQHHRFMLAYREFRRQRQWRDILQVAPKDRRVGVMGLGILGGDAIDKLRPFGFDLAGWTASPKKMTGVRCYHGDAQLPDFLKATDILLCLLPLTPATRQILNKETFALLPPGAAVINLARGEHLNEKDLLAALDSGHLSGAILDVFEQEPLPGDSPLWDHPKVSITPHIASMLMVDTTTDFIVENIRRFESGGALDPVVDFSRGY